MAIRAREYTHNKASRVLVKAHPPDSRPALLLRPPTKHGGLVTPIQRSAPSYCESSVRINDSFAAKLHKGTAGRLFCVNASPRRRGYPGVIRGGFALTAVRAPAFPSCSWPAAREEKSDAGQPISAQNNKAWCWSTWAPARPERASFAWRERDWPPCCLEIRAVNQGAVGGAY